jgi:hypothetical protein
MKIKISHKRVTRASTGTSMALGQKLALQSRDTIYVDDNIRKNCTKKSQIGYGGKRKKIIVSKPITLKRIQKIQESRIKVDAINAEILLQAREKEINDELTKRIAYLENQISSMNHATINILKNTKNALSIVAGESAIKGKSKVNKGKWVTIEENIVGVSAVEAGAQMNETKWVTIEEEVIGWKPMVDSNEGDDANLQDSDGTVGRGEFSGSIDKNKQANNSKSDNAYEWDNEEDDISPLPRSKLFLPSAKKELRGSGRKKTANFNSILSNMERHERLNEIDQNKEAAAAAKSNTYSPAEEERRSILLMKYIVDNCKRKSQSKNLLAKSTLDWGENVQTCVSKYA